MIFSVRIFMMVGREYRITGFQVRNDWQGSEMNRRELLWLHGYSAICCAFIWLMHRNMEQKFSI